MTETTGTLELHVDDGFADEIAQCPTRTRRTPSGHVTLPSWAQDSAEQALDHWSRTRSDAVHRMMRSGDAETVVDQLPFPAIRTALEAMIDLLAPESDATSASTVDVPIWELDPRGGVRRGVFRTDRTLATDIAETVEASLDPVPERISGGTGDGLREKPLQKLNLPEEVLVNPVAAYLGRPVTNALGWTSVAPVTGRTPNWNGADVRALTWSGHGTNYGTSRIGALLEGLERRVGALQSTGQFVRKAGRDLSGRVVTPNDFPAYPRDFYGHRGAPYQDDVPHEWVRGTSLMTDENAWLPREFVFYGEQMANERWALATSSGCATGSSSGEAALFGLLELLERDAFLASWYGRIPATRIDPRLVKGTEAVLSRARLLGYDIDAGLLWSPTGIPVAVAVSSAPEIRAVGAASHPDPHHAVADAISEAWAYIPERVSAARSQSEKVAKLLAEPHLVHNIDEHPLMFVHDSYPDYDHLCGQGEPQSVDEVSVELPDLKGFSTARGLLNHLLKQLEAEGVDVFAVVQTSPLERSLGLETVMVVAPELLPIDFGWGNQRALQSERLDSLSLRATGSVQKHRRLPHPFS